MKKKYRIIPLDIRELSDIKEKFDMLLRQMENLMIKVATSFLIGFTSLVKKRLSYYFRIYLHFLINAYICR